MTWLLRAGSATAATVSSDGQLLGLEWTQGSATTFVCRVGREIICCRFWCRLTPTLSGIAKGEQRQITMSVNDFQVSCRSSYSPSVA